MTPAANLLPVSPTPMKNLPPVVKLPPVLLVLLKPVAKFATGLNNTAGK
jgi:hypothetical protein